MAYTPYDPKATIDSIPLDFTNKVNVEPQYGQANLLLYGTGETDIRQTRWQTPSSSDSKNAYTKVVLRITKKEDKNDNQNMGKGDRNGDRQPDRRVDQKPGRHRPGNGLCQTYVGARQNMERLDRHADDDRAGKIHIPGFRRSWTRM